MTTTNTYDADGNLHDQSYWVWTDPNDSENTVTMMTTSNIYDGNGNLKETDQYDNGVLQTKTTTTYDADSQATRPPTTWAA